MRAAVSWLWHCILAFAATHTLMAGVALGQAPIELTEAEKQELLERYARPGAAQPDSGLYRTPAIYSEEPAPAAPDTGQAAPSQPTSSSALKPFGIEMFAGPSESAPPSEIASDENYLLGPGDEIVIYVWGTADEQFQLTVDREGQVFIPKLGGIRASGKTLNHFQSEIRTRLSKIYSGASVNVSLGKIRSIRVFLTGEVSRPGAYTVSSLTSVFNALYLAGGPSTNGSMRTVRLMRAGKEVFTKDLYDFLLKGDNSFDTRLESGDVIFLPVAGDRVTIQGEVVRPAIYELDGGETAEDLLALAGGPTPRAHLKRVHLERISETGEWKAFDLDLSTHEMTDSLARMTLQNGDQLTVYSLFEGHHNRVAIFGKVKYPGYYERSDTSTLAGLIAHGHLQDYDVFMDRAALFRRHADWRSEIVSFDLAEVLEGEGPSIPLQDDDSVYIYSLQEVRWEQSVHVQGEVNEPGQYPYYVGMTVRDLVLLAHSFTRSAYTLSAELARTDSAGNVTLVQLDLLDSSGMSIGLQEADRLYVRQIPEWHLHPRVTLRGEVQFPGEYVLARRDESLLELIQRAGGFTDQAFPRGTVFLRPGISVSLDQMNVRKQLERSIPVLLDTLGQPRPVTLMEYEGGSVNRIALDVERIRKSEGKEGNIVLQHGDQITVPPIPTGVPVVGAVGINGTIQFNADKKVKYYIERAGGFTRRADEDGTRLIRANGMAYSGGGTLGQKVDLGDVIAVPTKIEREGHFTRDLVTILTVATASLTAIILVSKI